MKASILMAGLATAAATFTSAANAQQLPTRPGTDAPAITISCFRGPWQDVIWDKPNAVFLEGLVRIGYSQEAAYAIGRRVCRDEYGIDNPDYLTATLRRILANEPPSN